MPNPHPPRRNGWTYARRRAFLHLLAHTGDVTLAATTVGLSPSSAYRLRKRAGCERFALEWDIALAGFSDSFGAHAMTSALTRRTVPVIRNGVHVADKTSYNDRHMIAVLKQLFPDGLLAGEKKAHERVTLAMGRRGQ